MLAQRRHLDVIAARGGGGGGMEEDLSGAMEGLGLGELRMCSVTMEHFEAGQC